tara:strand:+ start:69 stop:182 length:114 start_codon:yes stop_codon:yes gene_type:complete
MNEYVIVPEIVKQFADTYELPYSGGSYTNEQREHDDE